jgi:uncharacterized delta-60 repeat protein
MFTSFKRLTWKASLLAFLTSLLAVTMVFALPGDLDTSFSGDGLVTTDFSGKMDVANDIALQSDRKIVVAGFSHTFSTSNSDFVLVRYNPNGSLDTTFSGDGKLITNFGGRDEAWGIAVQSDGKIIAAGHTCDSNLDNCNLAIARYKVPCLNNNCLDTTFSGDGKQITDFGGGSNGSYGGLVIQPDGKIVVAGWMSNGTDYDFAVYRYKATCPDDGHCLDTTFGQGGKVKIGFGTGRQDFAETLAYQLTDKKIVVAGRTGDALGNNNNFALARLNPNGTLDKPFFSGDGKQVTDFGGNDAAYGFAGLSDGRMVIVGQKVTASLSYFAVARHKADGSLDTTFNNTGKKVFSIDSGKWSAAFNVIVQLDGRIVVLGATLSDTSYDFALVRLDSGGGFDNTFSGNGKVTIDFFGNEDFGFALARQPWNGRYVLAGYTNDNPDNIALARVLP